MSRECTGSTGVPHVVEEWFLCSVVRLQLGSVDQFPLPEKQETATGSPSKTNDKVGTGSRSVAAFQSNLPPVTMGLMRVMRGGRTHAGGMHSRVAVGM